MKITKILCILKLLNNRYLTSSPIPGAARHFLEIGTARFVLV